MTGCKSDEPEGPAQKERLILIYAVAANNLEYYLKLDKAEILQAGSQLNLRNNKVLLYQVTTSGECQLMELQQVSPQKYDFVAVEHFTDLPLSTSESRIREVIDYVADRYDYPYKGLVLWSHATGWVPWFGGSTPQDGVRRSFGADKYGDETYKTNINELAEAIPEGVFDFIWFDCCYMGNIETIFQLRNKTERIVGSVLEIASMGMPYDLTMPYLLQKDAQLEKACVEFYNYYFSNNIAASLSITETRYLPELAAAARKILATGTVPANLSLFQNYSRLTEERITYRFYDLGQLFENYSGIDSATRDEFKEALQRAVVYKVITPFNFDKKAIDLGAYSGLSVNNYLDNGSASELFYKELDWYKATREQ